MSVAITVNDLRVQCDVNKLDKSYTDLVSNHRILLRAICKFHVELTMNSSEEVISASKESHAFDCLILSLC